MTAADGAHRERWERTEELLDRALELPAAERAAFLDEACAGDRELRAALDSLIAADERAPDEFLRAPTAEVLAGLLGDAGPDPLVSDAAVTADAGGLLGRRLGPYEVVRVVGSGGMGTVFEARDTRLGRAVALKFLPPAWGVGGAAKERFIREARAASALDHPSIGALYDLGETDDGRLYLVLAYYDGETLKERLARGPLPVAEAVDLAAQVGRGLACAHAAGIVHRDVKPANVIVTTDGTAKILDFGVAKVAGDSGLTQTGHSLGTPAYMSPEQVRGRPADARSDVWSLGALLYEMLAGKRPFAGESAQSVLYAILEREPEPLRQVRPEVPEALEGTVARALAKDPAGRQQSAEELVAELAPGATASLLGGAPPPAAGSRARRPSRRRWRWLAGLAAVALGAAAAAMLAPGPRRAMEAWFAMGDGAAGDGAAGVAAPIDRLERLDQARELLRYGYRRGNPERAIELLTGALVADERDAPVYAELSDAYRWRYVRDRDPLLLDRVQENAELAVARNPDLAVAQISLGRSLWLRGDSEQALERLDRALRLEPLSAAAHRERGSALLAGGDRQGAAAAFRRAAELDGKEWLARESLGLLALKADDMQTAEERLREALALAPDNASLRKNLAGVLIRGARYEEAASELQRALEIEPTDGSYSNLGTLQFLLGRYEEARGSFQAALELGANHYLRWANLGDAERWTGRHEEAQEDYLRALQLLREELARNPENPTLRSRLALYLAKRGETAAALAELARLEPLPAGDGDLLYRSVVVDELAGRRDRALAGLERALAAGYPLEEVRRDPELIELRRDPAYHRLIARAETGEQSAGVRLPRTAPRPPPDR